MKKNTNKIALGIVLFLGILYSCFPLYYLFQSREALLHNYCATTPFIYRKAIFTSSVFTDALKQQGNLLCIIAFVVVVLVGILISPFLNLKFRVPFVALWLKIRNAAIWIAMLVLLTTVLFIYGNSIQPICTDEAFSIVNFAQQPLAHLLTYYPLPNNHIFFNLLNHFAGKIAGDYLLSGRILSGVFYVLLICGNFLFIQKIIQNKFISFLCSALLAQQLMVWGFGSQARGYSLYYLLQWAAFVSFYYYFFGEKDLKKQMLLLLIISNVFGLYTIPTFLYWILFEVLAALVLVVHFRQLFIDFWKAMLLVSLISFLLYLPVFCYSGLASVFANKYVAGVGLNRVEILQQTFNYLIKDIADITFGFASFYRFIPLLCFFIPLVLFALFKKKFTALAPFLLFGIMSWLAVFLIAFVTKQVPIFRAIGFQMQLSLLVFLLFILALMQHFVRKLWAQQLIFSFLLLAASIKVFEENKTLSSTVLYGQNTSEFMSDLTREPFLIKPKHSVWLSDESFMFHFLLDKKIQANNFDCSFNNQDILIISEDDLPNPLIDFNQYVVLQRISWFTIYQRKKSP